MILLYTWNIELLLHIIYAHSSCQTPPSQPDMSPHNHPSLRRGLHLNRQKTRRHAKQNDWGLAVTSHRTRARSGEKGHAAAQIYNLPNKSRHDRIETLLGVTAGAHRQRHITPLNNIYLRAAKNLSNASKVIITENSQKNMKTRHPNKLKTIPAHNSGPPWRV